MIVDVETTIVIDRPVAEVVGNASDPTNAPQWYQNIESVRWQTEPPARTGSAMTFVARFLGRRLEYTYEIAELVPGERLVMRTQQGLIAHARWCRTAVSLSKAIAPTGCAR